MPENESMSVGLTSQQNKDMPITFIDSVEALIQHSHIIDQSTVVGIDAEWPPDVKTPSASILQLATWSLDNGFHILILDLLTLRHATTVEILKNLLRSPSTLKLGFSLKTDLLRIANALQNESSTAVTFPVLDISTLYHKHIQQEPRPLHHHCSLSYLVNVYLAVSLDKKLQCSAWGNRPLTPAQIEYAAKDALCLLSLFDVFLGMAAHTLKIHPFDEIHQAVATNTPPPAVSSSSISTSIDGEMSLIIPHLTNISNTDVFLSALTSWGQRWERRGNSYMHQGGGIASLASPATNTNMKKSVDRIKKADAFHAQHGRLPRNIPWQTLDPVSSSSTLPKTTKHRFQPRFLADENVHGLAHQLRLWGIDIETIDSKPGQDRYLTYRHLVEQAENEERVILTRDSLFIRRNLSDQSYFVQKHTKKDQLIEIINAFDIPVDKEAFLSRCVKCNGTFGPRAVPAEQIPELAGIPLEVLNREKEFWVCSRCDATYWQGGMYKKAFSRLEEQLASMNINK